MSADRINRTPNEVTASLLIKRLRPDQLLLLVGQREYADYQDAILEKLQGIDNFHLNDFEKVHAFSGCNVNEIDTGKEAHLRGIDIDIGYWGQYVPIKRKMCQKHNVGSRKFYIWNGSPREV